MLRYFHLAVALFGARTALPRKGRLKGFWPTRGRLRDGDAIILDASPIIDGYRVPHVRWWRANGVGRGDPRLRAA